MQHATPATLAELKPLIDEIAKLTGLVQKQRGIFYRKGEAFLHFHEDETELRADIKYGHDWKQITFPRNNAEKGKRLVLAAAQGALRC
jgi:hypothetical protein